MQVIDMETWPRREAFTFFSGMSQPFYSVTFRLDVTRLKAYTKEHGLSFYYALVWLATKALNEVENFRYAISEGRAVLLDRRLPSFTDLHPGAEQFHIVTMPEIGDDIETFCAAAKERSARQKTFLDGDDTEDLIYFSCLPWVEITSVTNERDFDPDDSVPWIAWGKYAEEGGRQRLQMSLELNHRFVDGLHIGRFYEILSKMIETL